MKDELPSDEPGDTCLNFHVRRRAFSDLHLEICKDLFDCLFLTLQNGEVLVKHLEDDFFVDCKSAMNGLGQPLSQSFFTFLLQLNRFLLAFRLRFLSLAYVRLIHGDTRNCIFDGNHIADGNRIAVAIDFGLLVRRSLGLGALAALLSQALGDGKSMSFISQTSGTSLV
jgi:hypothetical protein